MPKHHFNRAGHKSIRIIFGAYALSQARRAAADQILEWLFEYGVNPMGTAPMDGNAEKWIGSWMEQNHDAFFISSKSRNRTYKGAWKICSAL